MWTFTGSKPASGPEFPAPLNPMKFAVPDEPSSEEEGGVEVGGGKGSEEGGEEGSEDSEEDVPLPERTVARV